MSLRIIEVRPPRIAQLLVVTAAFIHWFTPLNYELYSNKPLGIVFGLTGFGVMMWGWWLFRKYDTAICPTARSEHLVTTGIYRLTRNPMYLGIVTMLLAIAIYVGSLVFYLASLAYFLVINSVFCRYEEARLTEAFGKTYLSYKSKVRRWI